MSKKDAEYLIKKLIENKLTADELDSFLAGFGESDTEEEYAGHLKAYFDDIIEETAVHPVNSRVFDEASSISTEKKPVIRMLFSKSWIQAYKWAAAIILMITFYYFFQFMSKEPIVQERTTASVPSFVEKVASPGSKLRLNLNDGSFIHLNSASKLIIPSQFNRWDRHVNLSGEAYFKVSRDEHRPFTIAANNMTVEVLGTSFNVRAYDDEDEMTVTVESGKVLVKLGRKGDQSSVLLVKGQKVVFNSVTGAIRKLEVDPSYDICWTQGTLKFNKTRMENVERILERWYAVDIEIDSPRIYSFKLTGEHHNKNLKSVMEALKFALNIKYEIKGNHVTLKL